ncbi:TATA element modulatory factor-like isoform X2 [Lineus longissimus]|uniref:TATA element modulatory factor-like isoform X2 n=1 Tax=Lineus longissimus TaxID=88925 RepID=UPI002B4F9B41
MSWWDTSQFTSMASSAIKSAQKKIDNVLDIKDDELGARSSSKGASSSGKKAMKKLGTGDEFWNAYLETDSSASANQTSTTENTKSEKKESKVVEKTSGETSTSKKSTKKDEASLAMGASGMSGAGWGTWSFSGFSFGSEPVSGEANASETKSQEKEAEDKKTERKDVEPKKSSQKERSKRSSRPSLTKSGSEKEVDVQKWVDSHDSGKSPDDAEKGHEFDTGEVTSDKILVSHVTGDEVVDVLPSRDVADNLTPKELSEANVTKQTLRQSDLKSTSESGDTMSMDSKTFASSSEYSIDLTSQSEETVVTLPNVRGILPEDGLAVEIADSYDGCDNRTRDNIDGVIENVPERLQQPLVVLADDKYGVVETKPDDTDKLVVAETVVTEIDQVVVPEMEESVVVPAAGFGAVALAQMESTGLWEDADLEVPADMLVSVDEPSEVNGSEELTETDGGSMVPEFSSSAVEVKAVMSVEGPGWEVSDSEINLPEESSTSRVDLDKDTIELENAPLPASVYPKEVEDSAIGDVTESVELPPDTQNIEETVPDEGQVLSDRTAGCDVEESVKSDSKELVNSSDSATSSSGKLSLDMNTSRDTETDVSTETLKDGECAASDESCDQEEDTKVEGKMEESTISMTSSVSSASFVKCMLEEAMAEPEAKHEDVESHSTSSDKSSDMVKIDSGHTSGDEIDTTTSSDIEIISTPTSNGDRIDRPFDLSPLRHALSRTVRRVSPPHGQTHKRTDSNSSSSGHSKESDLEQLSPGREYAAKGRERTKSGGDHRRLQRSMGPEVGDLDESEAESNPLQSDRLLKKLAETAEVLEVREKKVLELSREVMDMREANNILRQQLLQSEEAREAEMTDLSSLTEEFTIRLSEQEKKLQAAFKERDNMKKQLTTAQEELLRKAEDKKAQKLLEERDEQINELLMEGEKLSKQQLQSNNAVKKLRAKEKDTDAIIKTQKQKLESQEIELEHLRKVLDSRDETEANQTIAINQLTSAVKYQDKEIEKFKSELEDTTEKNRALQTTLDNAYKEIGELNKVNAARDIKAQEKALSVERQAREELKLELDRQIHRTKHESVTLVHQIEDLQLSLTRMEKECGRREDILRQEISDLHMRLQEADSRNEELSQSVSAATRPLLRQIENLQSTCGAQSRSWEKIERNLTERLGEAQTQVADLGERERLKNEKVIELSSRVSALETQVGTLRQEKSQLVASLEIERAKLEVLEDTQHKDGVQVEIMKQTMSRQISELKKEKILLENQLEMEKMKIETEKKKLALAQDQIKEKDRQSALAAKSSPSPVPQMTRSSSQSSDQSNVFFPPVAQDDVERTLMLSTANGSKMNLYETLRQSGAANLLENLQSQLKLKEGEIVQLQSEIGDLERTRESMARELVNLTNKNQDLEEKTAEFDKLTEDYKALDKRNDALLQMYGEKDEEVQELRLDLRDVKELYKTQIQELLSSR